MNYQAMKINDYYVLKLTVGNLKQIIKQVRSKKSKKNVLKVDSAQVKWIEVELELEGESFFVIGFLQIDFNKNFSLKYDKKLLKKGNDYTILLKVQK
jgi:hypothetical protein